MQRNDVISNLIIISDSLSDRGTLYTKKILDLIPMRAISGLDGKSPQGSFTNGFTWADDLSADIANKLIIKKLKHQRNLSESDIADAVIVKDPSIYPQIRDAYNLKNDLKVLYDGQNFVRTYAEGGLTSHSYSWAPSKSIVRFFTRIMLPHLAQKRHELMQDDIKLGITTEQKAQTMVIEWTGANDLITVNAKPSFEEANKAIRERIKNVKFLSQAGYKHFVLFNIPDLSLTPRYQQKTSVDQREAHFVCRYFNKRLQRAARDFMHSNPDISITIYDIDTEFVKMYNNPHLYNIDPAMRTQPYTKSKDFTINANNTSPADGYMFWDDIHPTADVHAYLTMNFISMIQQQYTFVPPSAHHSNTFSKTD